MRYCQFLQLVNKAIFPPGPWQQSALPSRWCSGGEQQSDSCALCSRARSRSGYVWNNFLKSFVLENISLKYSIFQICLQCGTCPRSLIHRTDLVSSIDMAWVSTSLLCCPATRSPRQISSKMVSWQRTIKESLFKGIVGKLQHIAEKRGTANLSSDSFWKICLKRFSFWI